MASRQATKNGCVLLQLANLERFRERSLLIKNPKLDIGSVFTNVPQSSNTKAESIKEKRFPGQNYWNAHISQGCNASQHGSSKFGNEDS